MFAKYVYVFPFFFRINLKLSVEVDLQTRLYSVQYITKICL